eukprot:m.617991 g.617991  ORF g.617991 m.617991 type:complete len:768 (-) comp22525_c1_seq5:163-2466(-)
MDQISQQNATTQARTGHNVTTDGGDEPFNMNLGASDTNLVSKVTRAIVAWASHTRKSVRGVEGNNTDEKHKEMNQQLLLASRIESRILSEIEHTQGIHEEEKCAEEILRSRIAKATSEKNDAIAAARAEERKDCLNLLDRLQRDRQALLEARASSRCRRDNSLRLQTHLRSDHNTASETLVETKDLLERERATINALVHSSELISSQIDETTGRLKKAELRLQSALLLGRETAEEMSKIRELANEELVAAIEGAQQQAKDDATLDDRANELARELANMKESEANTTYQANILQAKKQKLKNSISAKQALFHRWNTKLQVQKQDHVTRMGACAMQTMQLATERATADERRRTAKRDTKGIVDRIQTVRDRCLVIQRVIDQHKNQKEVYDSTCARLETDMQRTAEQHAQHQAAYKTASRKHARLEQVLQGLDTQHQQEEMLLRDEHAASRARMSKAEQADADVIAATAHLRKTIATESDAAAHAQTEAHATTDAARRDVRALQQDASAADDALATVLARLEAQTSRTKHAQDAHATAGHAWESERATLNAPIAALETAIATWDAVSAQLASRTVAFEAALATVETDTRVHVQRRSKTDDERAACEHQTRDMQDRIETAIAAAAADRASRTTADNTRTTAQTQHAAWQEATRAATMALRPTTQKVLQTNQTVVAAYEQWREARTTAQAALYNALQKFVPVHSALTQRTEIAALLARAQRAQRVQHRAVARQCAARRATAVPSATSDDGWIQALEHGRIVLHTAAANALPH